jgi:hypothetical protein
MKAEGGRRQTQMLAAFCLPLSAFAIVGLFMRQHTRATVSPWTLVPGPCRTVA